MNSRSLFRAYGPPFRSCSTTKPRNEIGSPAAKAKQDGEVGGASVTSKAFTLCLHPHVRELDWLSPRAEDNG